MELIPVACQIDSVMYMALVKKIINFWSHIRYLQVLQETRD
jgi:hypothetical protein